MTYQDRSNVADFDRLADCVAYFLDLGDLPDDTFNAMVRVNDRLRYRQELRDGYRWPCKPRVTLADIRAVVHYVAGRW